EADATHPPTAERVTALGLTPQSWPWPASSAQAQWLRGEAAPDRAGVIEWRMWHGLLNGVEAARDLAPLRHAVLLGEFEAALALAESAATDALPAPDAATDLLLARANFATGRLARARDLWASHAGMDAPRTAERDAACRLLAVNGALMGL